MLCVHVITISVWYNFMCTLVIFRDEILNELVNLMSDIDIKMLVSNNELLKEFVGEV